MHFYIENNNIEKKNTIRLHYKMTGETNLDTLINQMQPKLNEGEYVFVSVPKKNMIPRELCICEMVEKEGITLVLPKQEAEKHDLSYDFVCAWITLNIHSSLEAVGLTAAFSTELAKNNISCNVVAGYYHDHIFVDIHDKNNALDVLSKMKTDKE